MFDEIAPHTPRAVVLASTEFARSVKPDMIVSLGGGSAIDLSKMVQICLGENVARHEDLDRLYLRKDGAGGLAHAMEGRRLFKHLTVESNLRLSWSLGAWTVPWREALADVLDRFPILSEKAGIAAGLLSGGQQQMIIISCATIRAPRYLLLDEPSLGLAPIIVTQIYEFITSYAQRSGSAILLAEQMATLALRVSDRGYVLRRGRVVQEGDSRHLMAERAGRALAASYL